MARLWSDGFELRSVTDGVERANNYGIAINTAAPYISGACAEMIGAFAIDEAKGFDTPFSTSSTRVFARFRFKVSALPSSDNVAQYFDLYSGATNVVSVQVTNNGTIYHGVCYYNNFASSLPSGFTVTPGTWYTLEIEYDSTPANGSEVFRVRLNGSVVDSATNLNFTTKTVNTISSGVYNGSGGSVSDGAVECYLDDLAVNDTSGSAQTSFPGEGHIVHLHPSASGDNAATAGTFAEIDEITPDDSATDRIQLDTATTIADYNVEAPSNAGIGSGDSVILVEVGVRIKEEVSTTTSYNLRIKSAAGGTTTSSGATDAGNTAYRTNPTGTTAFTHRLVSYTDPTTAAAWTPTGTNSLDNMQIGVRSNDADDIWVSTLWALVEYLPNDVTENDVTKSLAYSVAVEHGITKTARYLVTAEAAATKSLRYAVVVEQPAVEKSLTYRVAVEQGITKGLIYLVTSEQAATKSLAYAVTAAAAIEKTLVYAVAVAAAITKSLAYLVTAAVAVEKSLEYQVTAAAEIQKGLTYTVVAPASVTKGLVYLVSAPVAVTKSLTYVVKAEASVTKSLQYTIRNSPGAVLDLALEYIVVQQVAVEKQLTYLVRAVAEVSKGLTYAVSTLAAVEKTLRYAVAVAIALSKGLTYAVLTDTAVTKSLQYTVQTPQAVTKGLIYTVSVVLALTRSLTYAVIGQGAVTKTLAYHVLTVGELTKSLTYAVATEQGITKGTTYTVRRALAVEKMLAYAVVTTPGAITKGLAYVISENRVITLALRYAVALQPELTKGLQYIVLRRTDLTKTLTYVVVGDPYSPDDGYTLDPQYTPSAEFERVADYTQRDDYWRI